MTTKNTFKIDGKKFNVKMKINALLLLFIPFKFSAQISGLVIDKSTNTPIVGAKIIATDGSKIISDFNGEFKLNCSAFPFQIKVSMLQYQDKEIQVEKAGTLKIELLESIKNLGTVVVSAGRRQQAIEDVPVSMEIIRPQLIDNKGITDLEQAVDQSPGVYTMDGQVSIRGGGGFSYGAGSRVLVLWNGMPLLSGYAGDTQWNAIPMEQAAQIEIMKGAASVLYGSGALNGVISLIEKEPGIIPETKVKVQYGIYDNPARNSLKWWSRSPMNQQVEAYHGQMFKKVGYTLSTTLFNNDGYRAGETEQRGRISGTLFFKPQKIERLKAGIGFNYQYQKTGNFLIWESDSLGYTPSGGADTSIKASTLTYNIGQRFFVDPYLKYIDKHNNRHNLKARVYYVNNANINNAQQGSGAIIYFSEYQFQKQFKNGITLTSGISDIYNVVTSKLFGDHTSNNIAVYGQYEHKIGKLDITAGARLEYFEMDGKSGDTDFILSKKWSQSIIIPIYPVFRTGLHYELAKFTHLRASFGQGIRYPAVGERFIQTSVGALNIFSNPNLRPEIGWSSEIGIKQGLKIGSWKGMFDISAFINQYSNMTEFSFGIYKPDSIVSLQFGDPSAIDYYANWFGFQAQNAEEARITGLDFSFNSSGKLGNVEIISLIGYTYMNPISLNSDSLYTSNFSDSTSKMLKYRFKHLAKADVEANYKKISLGFSCRYNSFMSNIDRTFEDAIFFTYILPGLKEYRKKYNKGVFVIDFRLGYKLNDKFRIGLIANNIFNAEYSSRPGDIQAPRNFMAQLQMKF
jgi:outer membrane receptor protein involved in Fe transport